MAKDIKVPEMGESVTEATILNWIKKEGDAVEADEVVAELETDKVTMEVRAPAPGIISKVLKQVGDTVKVGEIIGSVEEGQAPATSKAPEPAQTKVPSTPAEQEASILPAAMKLIQENNLNPKDIKGTGRNGQITKEDVILYLESKKAAPSPAPAPVKPAQSIETKIQPKSRGDVPREKIVPMSKLRQTIAQRLVESQHTAAILTTFNEVDMYNVMNLRAAYKDKFKEKYNVNLGFMSFFTKAVIYALKEIPELNAEIRGTNIIYKNYYDIGVAVGGPKGLVVPVVRDADLLSLAEIEAEIARLANRVREGKISLEELEGGTFSISNGGVYGSLMSTPIINPPQSGILGMHNIVKRPVVIGDKIEIRPMMYIALSYDHRIVDGKGAVTFLVRVKEMIEDPARLLLEV